VVQTCFVNRNEVAHSRMLCHAAEQALFQVRLAAYRPMTIECIHLVQVHHAANGYLTVYA
jgi:hypothetical protein